MQVEQRTAVLTAMVTAALALGGCAAVKVQKLDADGKVVAGAAEGLRFYLPRPYVSVFEPFIVSSKVHLVEGELSADQQFVLITKLPPGLDRQRFAATGASAGSGPVRIASASVPVIGGRIESAGPAASAPAPAASAASAPAPTPPKSSGVLNIKATNDNAAFAVTPQPRYFNILWLPDFEEQYVVNARAGLGNAGATIGFGQGWSLQSLDVTADNSALVKPLLDFYGTTLASLQKLATAKIEAPLAALAGKGGQQSAGAPGAADARVFDGGTPLTLKVTEVRVVAPGLYPILKPKELKDAAASGAAATAAQGRILQPVYPYTNIAFNTYDVLVVEAVRPSGDSALRIHQYVDSTTAGSAPGGGKPATPTPGPGTEADRLNGFKDELRGKLQERTAVTTAKKAWGIEVSGTAAAAVVTLTERTAANTGDATALPSVDAVKALAQTVGSSYGVTVAEVKKP